MKKLGRSVKTCKNLGGGTAALAIKGGKSVRTKPFTAWPMFDKAEEKELLKVLKSGKWWRFAFGQGVSLAEPEKGDRSQVAMFQEEFARQHDCKFDPDRIEEALTRRTRAIIEVF